MHILSEGNQNESAGGDRRGHGINQNGLMLEIAGLPIQSSVTIDDYDWHHVAYVIEPQAGNATPVHFYLDGVKAQTMDIALINQNGAGTKYIGRFFHGSFSGGFHGLMYEIVISNTAMTESQISTLYNGGNAINVSSLDFFSNITTWWKMDDKVNNIVYNNSTISNDNITLYPTSDTPLLINDNPNQ